MSDRGHEVRQRAQAAIRPLRDAEDWALLVLGDPSLAARFRECYECITDRVLEGRYGHGLSRSRMEDVIAWVDAWAWDNLPRRDTYDATLDEPRTMAQWHARRAAAAPPTGGTG